MIGKQFILAGKAIFTVEVPAQFRTLDTTKPWYTFQVTRKNPSDRFPYVSYLLALLTGPDNMSDYTYIGKLLPETGIVKLTPGSKMTDASYPLRLVRGVFNCIWNNCADKIEANGYHVHHVGKCGRCGRALTVPASIESGFGPECVNLIGGAL